MERVPRSKLCNNTKNGVATVLPCNMIDFETYTIAL